MVTWQMTSRDPKRSRSWPRYFWSSIFRQPCEIHCQFILTTNRKPHIVRRKSMTYDVTWPQRSKSWAQYLWSLISQVPCELYGRFKLTTHRKHHIANAIVTWQMTSCDPKTSRSWPRYLWSWISRQPCEIRFILTTNMKTHWESSDHMADDVTWPERSKSWPQ